MPNVKLKFCVEAIVSFCVAEENVTVNVANAELAVSIADLIAAAIVELV